MNKPFLIFGVYMQMASHDVVSAKQIAERYEISIRSVYRYVDALCMAGLPVVSKRGKGGGFCLPRGFFLEKGSLRIEDRNFIVDSIEKNKIYSNPKQIARIKNIMSGGKAY